MGRCFPIVSVSFSSQTVDNFLVHSRMCEIMLALSLASIVLPVVVQEVLSNLKSACPGVRRYRYRNQIERQANTTGLVADLTPGGGISPTRMPLGMSSRRGE